MKNLLLQLILAAALWMPGVQSTSGDWAVMTDVNASYTFMQQVNFVAKFQSQKELKEAYLFIEPFQREAQVVKIDLDTPGEIHFNYDLEKNPLRVFSNIEYWYRLVAADGSQFDSDRFNFLYSDNRFEWQHLGDQEFDVYWYAGDMQFGQTVLNTAHSGLDSAQKYIPLSADPNTPQAIKIFVYDNAKDLQKALQLSASAYWVAGHASPDLGTILVSIPGGPEQQLELERQIPHEITHILQYRFAGEQIDQLPIWWLEGTASLAELYPNPDYALVLNNAVENETVIPIESLNQDFPRDASNAFLAYSESASFSRYLYQNYGKASVEEMLNKYLDGIGWEEGIQQAFGTPLTEIQYNWQQKDLGVDTGLQALKNLSPYMLLFLFVLVPPVSIGLKEYHRNKKTDGK